jgi:hypothetical protein
MKRSELLPEVMAAAAGFHQSGSGQTQQPTTLLKKCHGKIQTLAKHASSSKMTPTPISAIIRCSHAALQSNKEESSCWLNKERAQATGSADMRALQQMIGCVGLTF